jgi:RES domain
MSPAGIPLFYCADDIDMALAEVGRADDREFFTVGRFATTKPIEIVNLVDVPRIPSIFDPVLGRWQGHISFLNDLVEELRKSVETTRANLDYVPTQVFCEYFLHVFRDGSIRGLAWKSAATSEGGRCFALNIPHADCVNDPDSGIDRPQLEFVENSKTVHRRRIDEFREI